MKLRNSVLEQSKQRRIPAQVRPEPRFNLVLAVDSYKFCHQFSYPDNIQGMASYITARTNGRHIMIPSGTPPFVERFLCKPFIKQDIDDAEVFASKHGVKFSREIWDYILEKYHGYLPLLIRAVPEGTPIPSGQALVSIICVDEEVSKHVFWLCSYIETMLVRGIWYPTTIATNDYAIKKEMAHFYRLSGADMNFLPFALHDFGGRGVTCHEQAQIGGAAHTFNFMGSDTVEGVAYANYWYNSEMSAYSVWATEHSVECSYGLDQQGELNYIQAQLDRGKGPNAIISIVGDGKDIYRFVGNICIYFKDQIIKLHEELGVKVVIRPDSGDPLEVIPRILSMLEKTFGSTLNGKKFKKLYAGVGILQGDGVDSMLIKTILGNLVVNNWAADNIVFGSGGGLLQKVNRDDYKFAQKASAILVDGVWKGIAKDPITDQGKKSQEGLLTTVRSKVNNEYMTVDISHGNPLNEEFEDVMVDIYDCGDLFNRDDLSVIRQRIIIT